MSACRHLASSVRVLARATLGLGLCGCSTTLDPVVRVEDDEPLVVPRDAGERPTPSVLMTCSVFASATREYELCAQPLTWFAAEHDCALRDAELASVETDAENGLVADAAVAVETNVWLSGTRDDDLVWRWTTGQIFWRGDSSGAAESGAYTRWAPSEPNDASTVSTDPERCLVFTLGSFDWNDRVCSLRLPYLCERPAP